MTAHFSRRPQVVSLAPRKQPMKGILYRQTLHCRPSTAPGRGDPVTLGSVLLQILPPPRDDGGDPGSRWRPPQGRTVAYRPRSEAGRGQWSDSAVGQRANGPTGRTRGPPRSPVTNPCDLGHVTLGDKPNPGEPRRRRRRRAPGWGSPTARASPGLRGGGERGLPWPRVQESSGRSIPPPGKQLETAGKFHQRRAGRGGSPLR